jgi:hypothetical protein
VIVVLAVRPDAVMIDRPLVNATSNVYVPPIAPFAKVAMVVEDTSIVDVASLSSNAPPAVAAVITTDPSVPFPTFNILFVVAPQPEEVVVDVYACPSCILPTTREFVLLLLKTITHKTTIANKIIAEIVCLFMLLKLYHY